MDSALSLEITIDRIGGDDGYPRAFQTKRTISTTAREKIVVVEANASAHLYLSLTFHNWVPIRGGEFLTAAVTLNDVGGRYLGDRPALLYNGAHDTPTYTSFLHEAGLFVVGLRRNDRSYTGS